MMIQPVGAYMQAAILQAQKAKAAGDYSIGAVVVNTDKIIAIGGNAVKRCEDPTQHAEIVAIRGAAQFFGKRHLEGCVLYATHEPCPMCAAAAIFARMQGIVYGATLEDMARYALQGRNAAFSWRTIDIRAKEIAERGDPKLEIVGEFMREECLTLFHS